MGIRKPGPNKRVFAFLIDAVIANCVSLFLSLAGIKIGWVFFIVYILFRDCYNGRSIGKLCVNLQVVNEDGSPADFTKSLIRNILMAIPFFPIIEYFVMINDSLGMRLGDKLAKTQVNDLGTEDKESLYLVLSIVLFIVFAFLYFNFSYKK